MILAEISMLIEYKIVHQLSDSADRLLLNASCCRAFEVVKGENEKINVKRLPKKPAPPRFGRKLTAKQKELATHICVDCGWIYCEVRRVLGYGDALVRLHVCVGMFTAAWML